MLRTRVNTALLAANVIGAFVYLKEASQGWGPPELRGMDAGEFVAWAFRALPVFLLFLLINVIWGVSKLVRPQWRSGRLYATVWLVWIIAFAVERWHP